MIPQAYFDKIKAYFYGDASKAWRWFSAPNPGLGGVSPISMIKAGRVEKLKHFIDNALDTGKGFYP